MDDVLQNNKHGELLSSKGVTLWHESTTYKKESSEFITFNTKLQNSRVIPWKSPSFPKISSGSDKGVFWKRGLFRKVHLLEILENLGILEILENPQTLENQEQSDHFLEILENLEILEILEIPPVKRPLL